MSDDPTRPLPEVGARRRLFPRRERDVEWRPILVLALELGGGVAVLVGLALIYEPLAWVVGGVGALLLAVVLEGGLGPRARGGGNRRA